MRFLESQLRGVFIIDIERNEDERGFFARTHCDDEYAAHRLHASFVQESISYNRRQGTLRGMHYQAAPHAEIKVVRCTSGAIHDVVIDLRPESPTFTKWVAVELTAQNRRMLYLPEGVAHGFQTLTDDAEVFYKISRPHRPDAARGVRWDDPAFAIQWPQPITVMSQRDREFPPFGATR